MDPSIICSVKMPWGKLGIYLFSHGHQVTSVKGDGFCFLNAIELVLYYDYNDDLIINGLASNILGHLVSNVDYYKWLQTEDILWDAEGCFKFGNYCDSVIDLIIIASTKALNMNLSIYQKGPDGNIQVI